jgi:hypothetical protein
VVRGDPNIIKLTSEFVPLRMTYLRNVDIGLFVYDYDQTIVCFFLDADCRIYSRYGSRDSKSAESHNSAEGLLHTMQEVLRIHKEEAAVAKPAFQWQVKRPADIAALNELGYGGSCVRCHMVHEANLAQQKKEGKLKAGAYWLYPPPENVGIELELKLGNAVRAITADSYADKAGLKAGDTLRSANGTRLLTVADFQFVLNGLEPKSRLTIEAQRDGRPVTAVLELDGDWRRSDSSWRMSARRGGFRSNFIRSLRTLNADEKAKLAIPADQIAFRLLDSKADVQDAGLRKDDIIIAFDGKRKIALRNPQLYMLLEHVSGEKMEVTYLRDGKEQTATMLVP